LSAIAALAGRLREAGRALVDRSEDDLLAALGRMLALWQDPNGPWQRKLAQTLSACAGFSEPNVRAGLRLALADWDERALREVFDRELGPLPAAARVGFPLTSIVCAGAIPMPTLLQIVLSLAVRSPALVKPASRDPVTAGLVAASLREIDPALADCVGVVPIDTDDEASMREFLASPCVVASGSDATIESIRSQLDPQQRFVGFGHRFSLALLGPGALDEDTAAAVAQDAALWDQLGCMSPVAIYAADCEPASLRAFAEALARAFSVREQFTPLGEIDVASAARVRHEREEARMRFAASGVGQLYESQGVRWTVVLEPDAQPRPAPLHRFLRIHPISDRTADGSGRGAVSSVGELLDPIADQLSTVAAAGFLDPLPAGLSGGAGYRVCQPGQMQRPGLGEPHDAQPLLTPLLPPF